MAADYSICLGTAGWGRMGTVRMPESSWIRHRAPFLRSIAAYRRWSPHPKKGAYRFLAGGDTGLFREPQWRGRGGSALVPMGANGANGALPTNLVRWSVDPG